MKLFNLLETSYDSFDNTIKEFITKTFGKLGQQYSKSNIFAMVFEGIKGVMQNMMFYIEDAVTEQNVFSATRKKSVYSLAKISGYEPYYGSAAVGTILLSSIISNGTGTNSSKVLIPNHTKLYDTSTNQQYICFLSNDYMTIDLTLPLVSYDVKIVQGVYSSASAIAEGDEFETREITVSYLFDRNYIEVYVNGEKWSETGCVYDMTENSKEYIINPSFKGNLSITFGNGVYGKKLSEGDEITIYYISHDGEEGNVKLSETPTLAFRDSLYDSLGNTIDGNDVLSITVSNNPSGGTDSDTIEFVRNMIGYNSRSLVLASEDNFKMFLNRFSFVGPFNLISNDDSLKIFAVAYSNTLQKIANTDEYFTLTNDNLLLSDYQKESIKNALSNSNKTFSGISLEFIDPIIRNYSVSCYVTVGTDYEKYMVKQKISDYLAKYFLNLGNNITFISKSDLIKYIIDNVSGIKSFDLDFICEDDELARMRGYWYKKELHKIGDTNTFVDVREIYDKTNKIGLDEVGNIRLKTKLEMPLLHQCTMYYDDDNSTMTVEPVNVFFL